MFGEQINFKPTKLLTISFVEVLGIIVIDFQIESSCDETDELVSESSKLLEVDMQLLGITAIEDRLQAGVTDAIESLRAAGIQVG